MMKQLTPTEYYEWLKANGHILLETVVGSQSYGTATPDSDVDKKFVYIQPENDILGTKYKDFVKITDDYIGYEIKRFLELAATNNPTVIELLNPPEDCIEIIHPTFRWVMENQAKFITKGCAASFNGYAVQQISKAKGQEKMQNWESARFERKGIIDFCYALVGHRTIPLTEFLSGRPYDQKFCGVSKIPNARDLYALFYDEEADQCFNPMRSEEHREKRKAYLKEQDRPFGFGYKGIVKVGDGNSTSESNQLRLSSIPKGEEPLCIISYNKDGYISHCNDYKKYQTWLKNHNKTRYIETPDGSKMDAKNMMHCVRLVKMAEELADGKGLIIRRPDAEELLKIRRGEVNLVELVTWAEDKLGDIKEKFKSSELPDKVDKEFVHNLLVRIRRNFYGEKEFGPVK